jgi:hypothetical protein
VFLGAVLFVALSLGVINLWYPRCVGTVVALATTGFSILFNFLSSPFFTWFHIYLCSYMQGHLNLKSFKQINQLDAAISQVCNLTFMYSSKCFGNPHAHHQVKTLFVVVWPVHKRQDHDQQRCYHHASTVKPEAANAVVSS